MSNLIKFARSQSRILIAGGLLLLVAAIYWSGLSGGFFFDDSPNILGPKEVQLESISIESLRNLWDSGIAGPLGRPVSMLSFAANYYFSGFNPFYFKLANLAIHCLNGFLAYFLTGLLTRAAYPSSSVQKLRVLAAIVATLWVTHPIQTTSVLYVVQRMTSLASMFMLLALISHIWARQRGEVGRIEWVSFAMAWGVFFPLAMLSKETGILLLLYVAAYEAILHRNWLKRVDLFGSWYLKLLLVFCAISLLYILSPAGASLRDYDTRTFTFSQRLLTEPRVIWEYIHLIVMPALPDFGLYHDDFQLSTGLYAPKSTFFAIAGLLLLASISWLTRIKRPLISFIIAWFLLGHSLESSIFPLQLMHEHRNYLPSLGLFMVLIAVMQSSAASVRLIKVAAYGGISAFAIYCALLSYLRADLYGDDFRRTYVESQYRIGSVTTQYEAGAALVNIYYITREPMLRTLADEYFERANSLEPTYKLALIGMLQLDCLSGGATRIAVVNELRARLRENKWIPLDRSATRAIGEMANSGTICLDRKQVDELFSAANSNKSTSAEDRSVIASDYAAYLWLGKKDYAAARDVLERAIGDNQNDLLNRLNLIQLYRFLGDREAVMRIVGNLKDKNANRRERLILHSIRTELAADEVLAK